MGRGRLVLPVHPDTPMGGTVAVQVICHDGEALSWACAGEIRILAPPPAPGACLNQSASMRFMLDEMGQGLPEEASAALRLSLDAADEGFAGAPAPDPGRT